MTGCSDPRCGGSCRLRRPCRPVLVAAATDGGASSRWAGIVCQRSVLVVLHACLSSSSRRRLAATINNSSISSTLVGRVAAVEPSSTLHVASRRRTLHCFTITLDSKTMNWRKSPSSPSRASNLDSSLTELPALPWPMDPGSFQVGILYRFHSINPLFEMYAIQLGYVRSIRKVQTIFLSRNMLI